MRARSRRVKTPLSHSGDSRFESARAHGDEMGNTGGQALKQQPETAEVSGKEVQEALRELRRRMHSIDDEIKKIEGMLNNPAYDPNQKIDEGGLIQRLWRKIEEFAKGITEKAGKARENLINKIGLKSFLGTGYVKQAYEKLKKHNEELEKIYNQIE